MPRSQKVSKRIRVGIALTVWAAFLLSGCGGGGSNSSSSTSGGTIKQTISFSAAPSLSVGGTATVKASASSGLSVTYNSITPTVCSVNNTSGLVTDLTAGTCTIAANQAGNSEYAAASQVTQSITITSGSGSTVATYHVIETFYEPDTQPNNSIFEGAFTYDSGTSTVSNLAAR